MNFKKDFGKIFRNFLVGLAFTTFFCISAFAQGTSTVEVR